MLGGASRQAKALCDEALAIARVVGDRFVEAHVHNTLAGVGWVAAGNRNTPQRGVMWDDDLRGMTITIVPRQNHTPSANDPEGWFVMRAFPERVR